MNYYEYGFVLDRQLKQTEPPFRNVLKTLKKCNNKSLPVQLRPYLSKHLRTLQLQTVQGKNDFFYHIFPIERIRLHQRVSIKRCYWTSVSLFSTPTTTRPEDKQGYILQ